MEPLLPPLLLHVVLAALLLLLLRADGITSVPLPRNCHYVLIHFHNTARSSPSPASARRLGHRRARKLDLGGVGLRCASEGIARNKRGERLPVKCPCAARASRKQVDL